MAQYILEHLELLETLLGSAYRWDIVDFLMLSSQEHYINIHEIYNSCVKEADDSITFKKIFKDFFKSNTILTLVCLRLKYMVYVYSTIVNDPQTTRYYYYGYILDFIEKYGKKSHEFIDRVDYPIEHRLMSMRAFRNSVYNVYQSFKDQPTTFILIYNLIDQFKDLLFHNKSFDALFNKKIAEYILEQIRLNNVSVEFIEFLSKFFDMS